MKEVSFRKMERLVEDPEQVELISETSEYYKLKYKGTIYKVDRSTVVAKEAQNEGLLEVLKG
jgi:hypothetical protein